MNREFESVGRRMPYDIPSQGLDSLRERIRKETTARPKDLAASRPSMRLSLRLAALTAAAVVVAAAVTIVVRDEPRPATPSVEQVLATAPTETLQQAAATTCDDIFNPQL